VRVGDLLNKDQLYYKIQLFLKEWNDVFERTGMFSIGDLTDEYHAIGLELEEHVGDVSVYLSDAFAEGKTVLFEGAQGTMLDMDHGTYPYVTSS
jgi:adenylosuccinate synthase